MGEGSVPKAAIAVTCLSETRSVGRLLPLSSLVPTTQGTVSMPVGAFPSSVGMPVGPPALLAGGSGLAMYPGPGRC